MFSYFLYHSKSTRPLTLQLQVKITSAVAEHRCLKSAHEQKTEMAEVLRGDVVRLEDEVRAALASSDARLVAAGQVRVVLFAVGSTAGAILQVRLPCARLVGNSTNTDVR